MDKKRPDGDDEDEMNTPKWAEMVKRVMSVGLGAAFMTEESIRNTLGDIKLPKEVINTILTGANRSKEEFLNRIGTETIKLISKIDFVKEASRFVEEHKFRINAEIDIIKKDPAAKSGDGLQMKTSVHIKE